MPKNTVPTEFDPHGKCPQCKANWDAGSIFDVLRPQNWCAGMADSELQEYVDHMYGTDKPQRFSRVVGIYCQGKDCVIAWRCPDCNHEWPRA